MAFVANTSFIPRLGDAGKFRYVQYVPSKHPLFSTSRQNHGVRRAIIKAEGVSSKDAMEFFRNREGTWRSYRTTHHLAFRQSESGESDITMQCLDASDERIVQLCKDNDIDPSRAQGGCHVTWVATLAWDKEGENHEGETIFALVPDEDDVRKGKMLRDRGYAEIVPIAGTYSMDEIDDLNLETPYDGGAVLERFSFDGPDIVNRLSTVKRFGGLSTSTFATEHRIREDSEGTADETSEDDDDLSEEELLELALSLPVLGVAPKKGDSLNPKENVPLYKRSPRWASNTTGGTAPNQPSATSAFSSGFGSASEIDPSPKPSSSSAFGSGFSGDRGRPVGVGTFGASVKEASERAGLGKSSSENGGGGAGSATNQGSNDNDRITAEIDAAAKKIGIDLSKVPPSMRDGYVESFYEDIAKKSGSRDEGSS